MDISQLYFIECLMYKKVKFILNDDTYKILILSKLSIEVENTKILNAHN